jgi:hypothetical protein
MRVDVGPLSYEVHLVRGWVVYRGEPCYGLCDHLKRRILIADVLDASQRMHVFVHELIHAWWAVIPGTVDLNDEEAVADLAAMAVTRWLLAVERDSKLLEFFHAKRGAKKLSMEDAAELEETDEAQGEAVRVRRVIVPADRDAGAGWVVRIFEAGKADSPDTQRHK